MAAFRLRWRDIRWSLLAVFLVGLGLMLNAWLPPQPRCVIATNYLPMNQVHFMSDDGGKILTRWNPWNFGLRMLNFDGPPGKTQLVRSDQGPFQSWDTHSGRNLGTIEANALASKKLLDWQPIKIVDAIGRLPEPFESIGYKETTKDEAIYSVREWVRTGPGFLQKFLGDWWPWPTPSAEWRVTVFETATGRILGQLQGRYGNGHLSDDGRTLVTGFVELDDSYSLRCWDLPLQPPLRLVIGIPLSIGLLFMLGSWWRGRPRARKLAT